MTKSILLYVLSDPHCGHKLGLMKPDTELFDEGTGNTYKPTLTGFQEYLYELFLYSLDELSRVSKNKDIVVILLGDITHGNRHQEQVVSTRISDQISIAQQALRPLFSLKNLKSVKLVFGTGSHELGEGSSMILLKNYVEPSFPKVDIRIITHGLLNINDKLIDYAHHGPGTGIRDWLNGNEVRFYLKNIIYKEMRSGGIAPDLVLRGHVHGFAHESIYWIKDNEMKKSSLTVVPSMCGMGEFGRQVSRSPGFISNGIVMYDINEKLSDPMPIINLTDIRIRETL
jgi:hypothetical protein